MSQTANEQPSRREFFRGIGRSLALGGLAALAAALAAGSRRGPDPGHECVNQGLCNGCAALAACLLPQALSARQARRT